MSAAPIVARVPTDKAARYMTQLAKHWSHRFDVALTPTTADIPLPFGPVHMDAEPEALVIALRPNPDADIAKMKEVVESHLNRFAFREGELVYPWSA
jgi:hypothetical protein